MKKKVLFVMHSAKTGGSTSSLLNLLRVLAEYHIRPDILLMSHTGDYMEEFRKAGNLLAENKVLGAAVCKKEDIKKSYGQFGLAVRTLVAIANKLKINIVNSILYQSSAKKIEEYDVVIAFQETITTDFSFYLKAKRKVAWVHSIIDKFESSYRDCKALRTVYSGFDCIICVAKGAAEAFSRKLPDLAQKVSVIPNVLLSESIKQKSQLESPISLMNPKMEDHTYIVSVGRLAQVKQYDLAIKAANHLKKAGIKFLWFIVGEGPERNNLERSIDEFGLQENVILTGSVLNPYPVIKNSDVLVISSSYEAQPMVGNEALILGIPVISTNYPTAYELINDQINGLICENSLAGITDALLRFITDQQLNSKLRMGASQFRYDVSDIINAVLEILDCK